jgi:hypothetical protein
VLDGLRAASSLCFAGLAQQIRPDFASLLLLASDGSIFSRPRGICDATRAAWSRYRCHRRCHRRGIIALASTKGTRTGRRDAGTLAFRVPSTELAERQVTSQQLFLPSTLRSLSHYTEGYMRCA